MIAVVDYGAANLLSVRRALAACGARVTVTADPDLIASATAVVLPGVGAAGAAMRRLRALGLDAALRALARDGRPLLGICLGMQLLFEWLEEDGATGLGLLAGDVPRLPEAVKIPHIGWNTLRWTPGAPGSELFGGLRPGAHAYFVHSYHCRPRDPALVVAWTDYGPEPLCAAVASGDIVGLQFHPEKSGEVGRSILSNWLASLGEAGAVAPMGSEATS